MGNDLGFEDLLDGIKLVVVPVKNPDIRDVRMVVEDKVVEVVFDDGEVIKTVCDDEDTFSLERAIEVATLKKLLGGSSAYSKLIRHGIKTFKNRLIAEVREAEELERIEKKRAKQRLKRKQREARRREEEIQKQAEIMARALKIVNESTNKKEK